MSAKVARKQARAAESGPGYRGDHHLSFESARTLFAELTPSRIGLLEALRRCGPCLTYALVRRTPEDTVFVPFESVEIRLPLRKS